MSSHNLDNRKMEILRAVVDEYIKTGEPVGSVAVLQRIGSNVSSATIRNDMAFLEQQGLLEQPHTSAGRVPTFVGYHFYIENLMPQKPLSNKEKQMIDGLLDKKDFTADTIIENAVTVLSDLTELAVVSKSTKPVFSVITRVEVIPAGRRLYALLIITSAGEIKDKICRIEFDISNEQLGFFAKFINENLTGLNVDKLTPAMLQNLAIALGGYMMALSPLLHAVYELSEEMTRVDIRVKGEQNLVTSGVKADEVVSLMSHKEKLDSLLSKAFDDISVVFGKENDTFAIANSSMIVSPYMVGDKKAGSFGVIGPLRVDYAKVIPNIRYITKNVTRLLEKVVNNEEYEKEQESEEKPNE